MVYRLPEFLFIFFAYSFLGWCMEMVYMGIRERRITKRGFLLGPCCPIYGVGMMMITLLLQHHGRSFLGVFLTIILMFSVLEYLVSVMMERVFHTRWWDYHDMRFNIRGRICLETMLPFGILGSTALYYINPFLMQLFHQVPYGMISKALMVLVVLMAADLLVSVRILHRLTLPDGEADHTAEIGRRVREAIAKRFE